MTTTRDLEEMLRRGGVQVLPNNAPQVDTVNVATFDEYGKETGSQDITFTATNQRAVVGYVTMYDTKDGEQIPVDLNRVPLMLKKVHRDPRYPEWKGKFKYTLDGSAVPQRTIGAYICPLNKDHPDHEHYWEINGGQPCTRRGIPTIMAVEDHVRVKHQQTWAYEQRLRARTADDEEREFRHFMMSGGAFNRPTEDVNEEPITKKR